VAFSEQERCECSDCHGLVEMRIVGLTGGIGTGKSTVAKELQLHGLPIIDVDHLAHEVIKKDSPGYKQVLEHFGPDILQPDYEIDRPLLGEIIFTDRVQRKRLNAIVQPRIAVALLRHVAYHWLIGTSIIVVDAPLLFETKLHLLTRPTVVVDCPRELQEARLVTRNGLSVEQANARIEAQMPLEVKKARATYVIDNSGSLEELRGRVRDLLPQITKRSTFAELACSRFGVLAIVAALVVALVLMK